MPTLTMQPKETEDEFRLVMQHCRALFAKKLHDYGTAWRVMRPETVTDQLMIKAARIRSLQMKGKAMVDEGITPEFAGIINYSIIGLIQLDCGAADNADMTSAEALRLYDEKAGAAIELMLRKNHDYDEAWRGMRISSIADLIFMKLFRTKQIEDLGGDTLVSEGVAANYMDMLNYSAFALIKLIVEHEGGEND